jgi:hypothetical protein
VEIFVQLGSCNMGSFVSFLKSGILRDAKYGMAGGVPAIMCNCWCNVSCEDVWELVTCEEGGAPPPCGGGLVCELCWVLVPKKVDPIKLGSRTMALTVLCECCVDVSTKWGKPPKIGGIFCKCLE